jgi:hypothetical protein
MNRSDIIFKNKLGNNSITQLSKRTGIPERTLYEYREAPETIPAGRLRLLFRAVGASEEAICKFFK